VVVLFWPQLRVQGGRVVGEVLGLSASFLWTAYGWQSRQLAARISGAHLAAQTMWRAGLLLLLPGLLELRTATLPLRADLLWVQAYCIVGGGVISYWLWNHALRQWPTSRVYLFNNLIPLSTMAWAHFCLGEPITSTFGVAMILIVLGVVLGQAASRRQPDPQSGPGRRNASG
jgi:drug/metabolite transporter (DMT)-like permease